MRLASACHAGLRDTLALCCVLDGMGCTRRKAMSDVLRRLTNDKSCLVQAALERCKACNACIPVDITTDSYDSIRYTSEEHGKLTSSARGVLVCRTCHFFSGLSHEPTVILTLVPFIRHFRLRLTTVFGPLKMFYFQKIESMTFHVAPSFGSHQLTPAHDLTQSSKPILIHVTLTLLQIDRTSTPL